MPYQQVFLAIGIQVDANHRSYERPRIPAVDRDFRKRPCNRLRENMDTREVRDWCRTKVLATVTIEVSNAQAFQGDGGISARDVCLDQGWRKEASRPVIEVDRYEWRVLLLYEDESARRHGD